MRCPGLRYPLRKRAPFAGCDRRNPRGFVPRGIAPGASDQAQQLIKDPYVFDFLRIEPGYAEKELEQSLVDRIQHTLSELGAGFSFVGRQVTLTVEGEEFVIDLLFFHVEQLRYVVVELKVGSRPLAYCCAPTRTILSSSTCLRPISGLHHSVNRR